MIGGACLLAASAIWFPLVHLLFAGDTDEFFADEGVPPGAQALLDRHLALWEDPELRTAEIARMRRINPEWDFMWRTYLAWSLANVALRDPSARDRCLRVIDEIIDDTVRLEEENGIHHFLMPYARHMSFVRRPARSHFLDGEIALMIGMRRIVEEKAAYRPLLAGRVRHMVERMRLSPVLSAESYPDECWIFCNTVALAAVKIADVLDGTDHSSLFRDWIRTARGNLTDPKTGLLVSYYSLEGSIVNGPEGSSIWMAAHCLQVIDEDYARDQYVRAKKELERTLLGFGFSREWPESWESPLDVDSGAVVPFLEAGTAGSGMAFIAASSFDDRDYLSSLLASLRCAGFAVHDDYGLRFAASNLVGDAVLLYASILGPVWDEVSRREKQP
jgi:hypothetical protein